MRKIVSKFALLLIFFFISAGAIYSAEFSLHPGSGEIRKGANFSIDILIDTQGEDSNLARAVLTFDPDLVQVIKAEKNESLYCSYPEDEQSIDNANGVIMLTGFCQSGIDVLYSTQDDPDVFARIQFEAIDTGSLVLDWEYSGEDEPFNTVVMAEGSPPQEVLDETPIAGAFSIVNSVSTPSVPNTGYSISLGMIAGGIFLLLLGTAYLKYRDMTAAPKFKGKTVVVYDKEN